MRVHVHRYAARIRDETRPTIVAATLEESLPSLRDNSRHEISNVRDFSYHYYFHNSFFFTFDAKREAKLSPRMSIRMTTADIYCS